MKLDKEILVDSLLNLADNEQAVEDLVNKLTKDPKENILSKRSMRSREIEDSSISGRHPLLQQNFQVYLRIL
jgi:hypothetical protein